MPARYYREKRAVVAILGATATGKTATAVQLCLEFQGEVVSVDSRYLYRGLDIGTAKPTLEERQGVRHHLIDALDPEEDYSLAVFQRDAYAAFNEILEQDRLPVMAGGTPLYVRAVLEGWTIPEAPPDPQFRQEMERAAAERGGEFLHQRLRKVDPVAAGRIPAENVRRVIRALEIHHLTGKPMTELEGKSPPPYRILELALHLEREHLYQRIDQRVDEMLERGLVDEVRHLLEAGVPPDCSAMRSIGYQEVVSFIRGEYDHAAMVERIKFNTHRYVRHQLTWLRKLPDIHWIDVENPDAYNQIARLTHEFLDQ